MLFWVSFFVTLVLCLAAVFVQTLAERYAEVGETNLSMTMAVVNIFSSLYLFMHVPWYFYNQGLRWMLVIIVPVAFVAWFGFVTATVEFTSRQSQLRSNRSGW